MNKKYIGAIDQGTTSTRFLLYNKKGEIVSSHQIEHKQIYPKPGWVEHDPVEIWKNTKTAINHTVKKKNINTKLISAVGITNQRETTVIWNKKTGKPYLNALVWQDTRTDKICNNISKKVKKDYFRKKTGLPVATYFSGPKIKWILDNIPVVKKDIKKGEVLFGNIDTWLIWNLTGGINGGKHITDVTNASRTMLMNIKTLKWDNDILKLFKIHTKILPEIRPSSDENYYGYIKNGILADIPVCGDLGDQQAALFGQSCFNKGEIKNTYGTGCFMLMNIGEKPLYSKFGLITTPAYKIKNKTAYALEGSIAITGALVQWIRDNLGLIKKSSEIETLAKMVDDNGGIYFVPAFSGLYAPYWKNDARGIIAGLTRYINKSHIARAALEATAFQTKEIYDSMRNDSKISIPALKVDGGMVVNELLMQFQSDILNIPVIRPKIIETTSLGAAYAAGLATGFWKDISELKQNSTAKEWNPKMNSKKRNILIKQWQKAVKRSFNWID